jgi:phosphatidylserine decarboxylase
MTDSFAAAPAAAHSTAGDVRRQGGWLPGNQDDLEAWLAGHRERVAAKGAEAPLHPVLAEFQALIDSDPVVRMYFSEMIAQVPRNRQYSKRQ